MAEGWARHLIEGEHEFHSAGLRATGVNPLAVRAMMEAGVDISGHKSKTMDDLKGDFHIVVTVCDAVKETCPFLPAAVRNIHKGFPDPPAMAEDLPEGARMEPYREVCAMIRRFTDTELRELLEQQ
jgi:arsenate reductase